jgi:hypothetical protein
MRSIRVGTEAAHLVALPQSFGLIPVTERLLAFLHGEAPARFPARPAFEYLSPAMEHWLAPFSQTGSIAYLEAEYFGGAGVQAAAVWTRGVLTLEPGTGAPSINDALRVLGVVAQEGLDQFDTLHLGRCRETERWTALDTVI